MTQAVAAFLFTAAWKGTLLVAFALAVHRVARNRVPSRWLCALLLVAIVRLLVPVAPSAPFSVFNLVPGEAAPRGPVFVAEGDVGRGFSPPTRVRGRAEATPSVDPWVPLLLALWGAGAVFVIVRAVLQTRRFQRQLADSVDVVRDDVLMLVAECRGILNVRRRVRVVTTSAVATPSLHGWIRPTLLLPAEVLASFSPAQLRYVVLHEIAHLRRSDVLVNWIATAAQALHWFNPLVRLAVARFAEERELACDALALAALRAEERPAYGGTVLELVDRMRASPASPALVGMTATPEQLKRRIVMIASFRQSRFSILFAALVVAVGLVTLTDARAGEPVVRQRMKEPASPEVKAAMQKLETPLNVTLTSVSIDDVLQTVMNASGASVVVADGAIDDATRAKRLNVKATNVPAHLVLFEALGPLHLAMKFTGTGVLVLRAPQPDEIHMRSAKHEATRSFIRKSEGTPEGDAAVRKYIEVAEDGVRGSGKRKLTLKTEAGAEEGTLEVELLEEN
jgi:beta-lactamase regulating signal transducer with metallopeptidase domain